MKTLWLPVVAVASLAQAPLRPPAVPLLAHDPYFSVWSMSDHLAGSETKHWTETNQPLAGVIRIGGKPYRFMGANWRWADPQVSQMRQLSREVTPTRGGRNAGRAVSPGTVAKGVGADADSGAGARRRTEPPAL